MSITTSVTFYRPGKPPSIPTSHLAEFVADLDRLGILDRPAPHVMVKLGARIDQDDKPVCWVEQVDPRYPCSGTVQWIDWDLECSPASLPEACEALRKTRGTIYRAHLSLGCIASSIIDALSHCGLPENKEGLCVCDLVMGVGPETLVCEQTEQVVHVGWMGIAVGGYGYLHPWTRMEMIERIRGCAPLRSLEELCRRTWPVPFVHPDARTVASRRSMPEIWCGDDFDAPSDWRWGISESF